MAKKKIKREREIIKLSEAELEDFDFTGGSQWEIRGEIYNHITKVDIPNGDDGEIWEIIVERESDKKLFKWDCWRTSYEYYMSNGNNTIEETFPRTITKVIYE